MPSVSTPGTKSGIITSTDGERHIPASVRPDGSTRREIKIRPGYKPPEDIEVYKNRTAAAWKTRGAGAGVPGAAAVDQDENKSPSNKNAKRREARKRAKAAEGDTLDGADGDEPTQRDIEMVQQLNANDTPVGTAGNSWRKREKDAEEALDPEAEKEKQARNLKKKLRQARELREKKEKGENLLPEQFAKVIKISELIRQLDSLGFDAEGERK
ncbi:MAG: hypothetical protein Q9208_000679 [Pyrenodesmia sp. 3 TL-2023]